MKKYVLLSLGVLLLAATFSFREWLLLEEISTTQNQITIQISQHMKNAPTVERVRELSTSSLVFERYLEPVVEISNRLLWPDFRADSISAWKRIVHTEVQEASIARLAELSASVALEVEKLRTETKPSLSRLYQIVEIAEGRNASMSCTATVKDEMKLFREASKIKDKEILSQLKAEVTTQIAHLKKVTHGMNSKQLGEFFTSGRFHREIQEPLLSTVFKIKQEEVRTAAWDELQKKLIQTLSGQKIKLDPVANQNDKAQRNIAKLIESMSKNSQTSDLEPIRTFPAEPRDSIVAAPQIEAAPMDSMDDEVSPSDSAVILPNSPATPSNPADGDQEAE